MTSNPSDSDIPRPPAPKRPLTRAEKAQAASFERRCKAAGLTDEMPEDMDAYRERLTRRISMFANEWRGCPELLCRRNRGCMAPNTICTNHNEEFVFDEDWDRARVEIWKALKERLAELGVTDA